MARPSQACETLILLDSPQDYREFYLRLCSEGVKECALICERLDPFIFNDGEIVDAISAMTRRHPKANVRVLVKKCRDIAKVRLKFVDLAKRLPSKIAIRKLTSEPQNKAIEYIVADRSLLLVRHNSDGYQGFYNSSARPEAQNLLEEFDSLWERQSADIPDLMTLRI